MTSVSLVSSVLPAFEIFSFHEDFSAIFICPDNISNALCSRLFSGFDLYLLLTLFSPYFSPCLRASVVILCFWLCLRYAVVFGFS